MKRNIYLEDIPLDEARAVFWAALETAALHTPLPAETIPLSQAHGRVTATAVFAKLSSPHYHASAMDGFAVRAQETVGATETQPLRLTLVDADQTPNFPAAQPVNTGHPLPSWANAVIMIEHVQQVEEANGRLAIEIRAAVPPWKHVRPMGEDIVATELVLPANHRLRPADLGALAGAGYATVSVYRQPRVVIIPTGSELVDVDTVAAEGISAGQIVEYNSLVLAAQVEKWGGLPTRWPIVPDEIEAIKTAVRQAAANHDLILLNAGSSAGSEDYTAHVVSELGTLLVHGVAVRPGHPVILGMIDREESIQYSVSSKQSETDRIPNTEHRIPIVGVPGYPVSAALTGDLFVEPLLARWQGQVAFVPPTLTATMTRKLNSPTGDDDFVRVAVGKVGDRLIATPIARGAGVITSLVRADGLVRVPRFSEGVAAGTAVTVHLYRSRQEIEKSLVVIGSHDLTLDLLAQFLAARHGLRLTSANVGSLGGLVALRRGEAHLAGSHLLDPETGDYNSSYIKQYLPNQQVRLVTLAGREQGWIVPAGNRKQLGGWAAVTRSDLRYVNRQRGAGTRVLLDYELGQRGLEGAQLSGYEREEYTHLAVAAAVASGTADFGLGIRAAATALELDFVPLTHEQYELVIPEAVWESGRLSPLLDLLHDGKFKTAVSALPGYDVTPMGEVTLVGSTAMEADEIG